MFTVHQNHLGDFIVILTVIALKIGRKPSGYYHAPHKVSASTESQKKSGYLCQFQISIGSCSRGPLREIY